MAAWGELEEIEAVDTAQFKAGEIVEGPLHAVVDLADDKGALAEDAVAAMGLDLTCADRRVSSWRRPTMTGDDESTKWRRQLMRTGALGLLAGVSEVEPAPRLSSSVAVRNFLVTRIIRQAKTQGPT